MYHVSPKIRTTWTISSNASYGAKISVRPDLILL